MLDFLRRKLKHEGSAKALGIALDGLNERASRDAVEYRLIKIERYGLPMDDRTASGAGGRSDHPGQKKDRSQVNGGSRHETP